MTRTAIIASLLAATTLTFASAARAEPIMGVYKGAGCDGLGRLPRYEGIVGHKLGGVDDFVSADGWPQAQGGAQWALACWQGKGYKLSLGVPLVMKGGSLSAAAAGEYDGEFSKLGAMIVANGHTDAMIRLGWEFNGDWYPWAAEGDPVSFKAAFRHVVGVLRSVPGQHFQIVWNPSMAAGTLSPDALWPGDDVVNLVGLDVYNQSWRTQDSDPQVRWQGHLTTNYGLNWLASFASAHKKAIVIPEWATGTRPDGHGWGDDPIFIHNMAAWMRAHPVAYQGYWDFTASDFDGTMSAGKFPQTLAAYLAEYGANH